MKGQASTIVRWPLWSWRNLIVTAAVFLLVLFGLGRVIEPDKLTLTTTHTPLVTSSPTPAAAPSTVPVAAPSAPAGPTAPSTTPPTPTTATAPGAANSESVTRVAIAFSGAWSSSKRSQLEWTRGIQLFVTPALAAGLAKTDPARVPATKVTGEAVLVTATGTSAQVRVPTDGGSIVVTLTRAASGPWQVSDVAPANQPPAARTPDLRPTPSPTKS